MKIYLISYSLFFGTPEFKIIEAIKRYSYWARPLETVWLIKTFSLKQDIINSLRSCVGPLDKILVIEITKDWISLNLSNEVVNWMKTEINY